MLTPHPTPFGGHFHPIPTRRDAPQRAGGKTNQRARQWPQKLPELRLRN